ncbi:cysteine proteinase [Gyrodon lividus]|nr:cysteine proteinase [Gyrodon lividus]
MSSNPKTFQEAESLYDRAAKSELASDFTTAFRLYLAATDAFLQLSRSATSTPTFQVQCKANAGKALKRAEKIKKASERPGAAIRVGVVPINWFGVDQQSYVLRKSSTVNNIHYPLWTEVLPLQSQPNTLYSDPVGQPSIPLSTSPHLQGYEWKRLLQDPFSSASTPSSQMSFQPLTPADIEQNIVNDCSLCASIAVCVQHNQKFKSKLLLSSLMQGDQLGRYDMKALFNGEYRRVRISIDNFLPFDNSGHPIGISTSWKAVGWPALIEKAYMKLMGGYDFPGSNSAIDLHVLTGWIPEHIELQSASFERERTWRRLLDEFSKGYCVLTVGTDAKTMRKVEGVKLLPSHNYAVVDVRETEDERWMTLLDSRVPVTCQPVHSHSEDGERRASSDTDTNSRMLDMRWDAICATFEGVYVNWDPALFKSELSFHGVWKPENADDKVQASIRHLQLLYTYQAPESSSSDGISSSTAPLNIDKDILVLLTRHLSETRRAAEYVLLTVRAEDEDDSGAVGMNTSGIEVKGTYTTSSHVLVGTKVRENPASLHTSQSTPPPSHANSSASWPSSMDSVSPSPPAQISGALSIFASYDGPFDDVFFSVNVFCGAGVEVRWNEDAGIGDSVGGVGGAKGGGFTVKTEGTLTTKNAGGNHTHPTYMLNPQWHLRIHEDNGGPTERRVASSSSGKGHLNGLVGGSKAAGGTGKTEREKASVVLSAQGPREVPLNVTVVWSSGERVVELAQKEVVTSSGAYTYGHARATASMAAGDYTVVLSAFEPQIHLGAFTLKVECSRQIDFTAIPQEGAGMYSRVAKGEWDERTAVGGPSHGRYHVNPIYEVQIPSRARFGARLHLISPSPAASLNLSLFPALASSTSEVPPLDRPMASSGPYSDALPGVDIPARMLSAGKYWLVPSTWAAGVQAAFRLVVYCSDSGCVVTRRE